MITSLDSLITGISLNSTPAQRCMSFSVVVQILHSHLAALIKTSMAMSRAAVSSTQQQQCADAAACCSAPEHPPKRIWWITLTISFKLGCNPSATPARQYRAWTHQGCWQANAVRGGVRAHSSCTTYGMCSGFVVCDQLVDC